MKKIQYTILLCLVAISSGLAQSNFKIGGGYFGNTLTYPGIVLETEWETNYTQKASMPLRIDVGAYVHKRYHTGIFTDINYGYRQYFKSGLFLEESIGAGVLLGILNNDATYEVNDSGEVKELSDFASIDFMPSLTLGIGYDLSKAKTRSNLIWIRPKVFWQYPHKTTSTYNVAIQVGYSFILSK